MQRAIRKLLFQNTFPKIINAPGYPPCDSSSCGFIEQAIVRHIHRPVSAYRSVLFLQAVPKSRAIALAWLLATVEASGTAPSDESRVRVCRIVNLRTRGKTLADPGTTAASAAIKLSLK